MPRCGGQVVRSHCPGSIIFSAIVGDMGTVPWKLAFSHVVPVVYQTIPAFLPAIVNKGNGHSPSEAPFSCSCLCSSAHPHFSSSKLLFESWRNKLAGQQEQDLLTATAPALGKLLLSRSLGCGVTGRRAGVVPSGWSRCARSSSLGLHCRCLLCVSLRGWYTNRSKYSPSTGLSEESSEPALLHQ